SASVHRDDTGRSIGVVVGVRPISSAAASTIRASDPAVVDALQRFVAATSVLSVAIGVAGIAGWTFGIGILKSVIPGQVIIKPNAAVALVLGGASLWLLRRADAARPKKIAGRVLAAAVALVGLAALSEHLVGWDLHIDQALFTDDNPWEAFGSIRPGLIAPITAVDFLLIGLALLVLDWRISYRSRRYALAQAFAFAANACAIVGLLDFVLGSHTSYTHVALQTAVAMFVLSVAVACART